MHVVLLNDTRADPNPGCQATVSVLSRQLAVALDARIHTRPRGEGYSAFAPLAGEAGAAHDVRAWSAAVDQLARDPSLVRGLCAADLVVANLEGTFHHHTVGALALGGTLALAHRLGRPVWALNGTVEAIDRWLLDAALGPAARVSVREPWSARWLAARGLHATLAADAAFLAAPFLARADATSAPARALYTPGVLAGLHSSRAEAVSALLEDLRAIADAGRLPVLAWFEDREAPLATAVAAHGWATMDLRRTPWTTIGQCLRSFDLVISGRYHLLVFAAMAGRPFLARPSNTHKVEGLLEHLGCQGAMAGDAIALARHLANDLPAPVGALAIARCQALAQAAVPRPDGTPAPPIVEGLDWVPAVDLPEVLSTLREHACLPLATSIATVPWDAGTTAVARVAPVDEWRAQFGAAGLDLRVTGAAALEAPGTRPPSDLRLAPEFEADGIGRRVVTITSAPVRSAPRAATARDVVVCAIIGAGSDLTRVAQSLRAVPPGRRRAIVRADERAALWQDLRREIVLWCESFDADVVITDDPGAVDWRRPGCQGVLVLADRPAPAEPRTWQAAFAAAARQQGWRCHVVEAGGPALPASVDDEVTEALTSPIRVALFGASSLGREKAALVRAQTGLALVCAFDNDPSKWTTAFEGVPVRRPEAVAFAAVDLIVLSSMHVQAIAEQVIDAGFGHALLPDVPAFL